MHTEFQRIITDFLKHPIPQKDKHTPAANQEGINIEKVLNAHEVQLNLYNILVLYLDNEQLLLEKNIASGQITDPNEYLEITQLIQQHKENSGAFIDRINYLNNDLAKILSSRDFLYLKSPTFREFERFSSSLEFNLFFLNDDFTRDFPGCQRYRRLQLDEENFSILDLAFMSSGSPQHLVSNTRKLLGIADNSSIALCYFDPRFNGFVLYVDPDDADSYGLIKQLSQNDPENIYQNNLNTWILNTLDINVIKKDLLGHFNVWVDTAWLTIYMQESMFPLNHINNPIETISIHQAGYLGSLFKQNQDNLNINKFRLMDAISAHNPFLFLKNIMVHDGLDFRAITDQSPPPPTEIALIKFHDGEITEYIAYYNLIENQIILSSKLNDHESEILLKSYLLNLAALQFATTLASQDK